MLREVEQMLGNLFFITKDQVQRPDGHAQHNDDVRQRTYLYIHLIRDNRHVPQSGHNLSNCLTSSGDDSSNGRSRPES